MVMGQLLNNCHPLLLVASPA